MTTETMAKRVRQHPFLKGLGRDQLVLLQDCALPAHFKVAPCVRA